ATGRWAPVHVYDRGTVRSKLRGEEFQAEINNARSSREQRWQAGWYDARRGLIVGNVWLCSPHCQRPCRTVLRVYSQYRGGETYGLSLAVRQDHALVAQELALQLEALRIIWGPADMRNPPQHSPRRLCSGLRFLPRSGQGPGRIWMRSPAEHHIAQDHGDCRVASRFEQVLAAHTRVDHRVWPALGKLLGAEIQDHMSGRRRCHQRVVQVGDHSAESTAQES